MTLHLRECVTLSRGRSQDAGRWRQCPAEGRDARAALSLRRLLDELDVVAVTVLDEGDEGARRELGGGAGDGEAGGLDAREDLVQVREADGEVADAGRLH